MQRAPGRIDLLRPAASTVATSGHAGVGGMACSYTLFSPSHRAILQTYPSLWVPVSPAVRPRLFAMSSETEEGGGRRAAKAFDLNDPPPSSRAQPLVNTSPRSPEDTSTTKDASILGSAPTGTTSTWDSRRLDCRPSWRCRYTNWLRCGCGIRSSFASWPFDCTSNSPPQGPDGVWLLLLLTLAVPRSTSPDDASSWPSSP